jgi:hypothetical protein
MWRQRHVLRRDGDGEQHKEDREANHTHGQLPKLLCGTP